QALDEDGDATRRVALVHDRLVVRATGLGARAALDGAVDVVVGHRRLLGLLDGVVERRVAGGVTTTHPGRDLDVLDELREELPAARVDHGLLVLGRGPLGVPSHSVPSLVAIADAREAHGGQRRSSTIRTNSRCSRSSPVISGWKEVASTSPCRTATILPAAGPDGTRARTSTSSPASSTHGARMKTACTGRSSASSRPSTTRSVSNESTWRPKALRRTVTSRAPSV